MVLFLNIVVFLVIFFLELEINKIYELLKYVSLMMNLYFL